MRGAWPDGGGNTSTLLLEIYRPRLKGKVARPLYDGRVVGLLAQPESLFTTAAQALDYQFGFKVSETWFFQLLEKNLPVLLLAQFAVLLLSTCVVFIDPGEQAVLERFGRLVPGALNPGAHLKWPWPVDKIYRYRTDQIQTFDVGFTPDAESQKLKTILWSVVHTKENNFLVGNRAPATVKTRNAETNDLFIAPPVGLIDVSIPGQFQITNVLDWAYNNADPTNLLQDLAAREIVRYLAGADLNEVLSRARLDRRGNCASGFRTTRMNIISARKLSLSACRTFIRPSPSRAITKKWWPRQQMKSRRSNNAVADAIRTNALAGAVRSRPQCRGESAAACAFDLGARGVVHQSDCGV